MLLTASLIAAGARRVVLPLLAVALPPYCPWWLAVTAIATGLLFGKHLYGGIGKNPFNPAMLGFALAIAVSPLHIGVLALDATQPLEALGDGHSHFVSPQLGRELASAGGDEPAPGIEARWMGRVGYLRVPGFALGRSCEPGRISRIGVGGRTAG